MKRYLKKYYKILAWISGLILISAIIQAFLPFIFGRIIDLVTEKIASLKFILFILIGWFVLNFLSDIIKKYTEKSLVNIGNKAANNMLEGLFVHLLKLPMDFHRKEKMGAILHQIVRGSDYLEVIFKEVVPAIIPGFLAVIIAIIITFWIKWELALILILVLFVYIFFTIFKTPSLIKQQKEVNKIYEKTNADLYDTVLNVQEVKSNNQEQFEQQKIRNDCNDLNKQVNIFTRLWVNLSFHQNLIFNLGRLALFTVLLTYLYYKRITIGEVVMFIGYVSLIQGPFSHLANNYRVFRRGKTIIDRALEILNQQPESKEGIILKEINGNIEFRNVSFCYQDRTKEALRNISFKANAGEIVALVGKSGGGKSTLVNLISKYYTPTQGKIFIDGYSIQEIDLNFLRRNIAIIPQEVNLFHDSIKNNIYYGNKEASEEEFLKVVKLANIEEFVKDLPQGYEQIVGERGFKLSGGQRQRIIIARAMLRKAKIFILDEPTASLDPVSEKLVQEAWGNLIKGHLTFIIAHRINTLMQADKILVLDNGEIIESGTHQELLVKKGLYSKLVSLQSLFIDYTLT